MLQLLLDGGQSYDDIASLLGISRDEVRTRARDALRDIGGADPDAEVGLTDYLLGQADPIGRADAARHLQSSAEANELARKVAAQLRLLAPNASIPDVPPARGAPPPRASAAPPAAPAATPAEPAAASAGASTPIGRLPGLSGVGDRFRGLSGGQRQLGIIIGAGVVLLVAIVLVATGVFGGGEESSNGDEQASSGANEDLTIVELQPIGESGASGQAVFARVEDRPVLQINLSGLEPTKKGESYIVWLFASDEIAIPVAFQSVGQDGNLTGPAPIPQELTGVLNQFQEVRVSLVDEGDARQVIQKAGKQGRLPPYTGQTVLQGDIPRSANADVGGAGGSQGSQVPTPTVPGGTQGQGEGGQ